MYSYYDVCIFLLLCMFRSRYCVSLGCSVYCLCVNVYRVLLPLGVNPIAVIRYIIYQTRRFTCMSHEIRTFFCATGCISNSPFDAFVCRKW